MSFATSFPTEFRTIGGGLYVIAEAGVAHFGRVDLANQLLQLAIDARADAFKLQVFDVDRLISGAAAEWKSRLRSRTLPFEVVAALRDRCRAASMDFILTSHDESRIDWLERLDVSAVKVGSGERNNPAFLARLAALGRPMIVSTGMHEDRDVYEAIDACASAGATRLALLHCVTAYPTPAEAVNLRGMDRLRELFSGPVGYSDHTVDSLAAMAAVARGAEVIEKHITILRDVPDAQDWKVSAGAEFPTMVADLRRVHQMLGDGKRGPSAVERQAEQWALKSLVLTRSVEAGHQLASGDLTAKRPGTGIRPNRISEVLGRRVARRLAQDVVLRMEDLES